MYIRLHNDIQGYIRPHRGTWGYTGLHMATQDYIGPHKATHAGLLSMVTPRSFADVTSLIGVFSIYTCAKLDSVCLHACTYMSATN